MKKFCLIVFYFRNNLYLKAVSVSFKTHADAANNSDQIIGVWQIVSPEFTGGGEQENIKIITKERFIWTHTPNGDIALSFGGYYSFDGEIYTENITFGTPNQRIAFGRKFISKVRFEGNKMYTSGGYEDDPRIFYETWERVE